MSYNPYESPSGWQPGGGPFGNDHAGNRVSGPVRALVIVTIISIVVLSIALLFDIWLVASGVVDQLEEDGGAKRQSVVVRMIWGALIIAVNSVILYGALQMKSLRDLGLAKTACYLSFPAAARALFSASPSADGLSS